MRFILTFFLFLPFVFSAQIVVKDYPRELQADIDQIDQFEPPVATSSCGEVQVTHKDQLFSGGCLGKIVRTFSFSDGCGNKAEAQQYILLMDSVKPVFDQTLENKTVKASAVPEPDQLTATDNSGRPIDVVMIEKKQRNKIIRTYSAKDLCGNESTIQQIITVKEG